MNYLIAIAIGLFLELNLSPRIKWDYENSQLVLWYKSKENKKSVILWKK